MAIPRTQFEDLTNSENTDRMFEDDIPTTDKSTHGIRKEYTIGGTVRSPGYVAESWVVTDRMPIPDVAEGYDQPYLPIHLLLNVVIGRMDDIVERMGNIVERMTNIENRLRSIEANTLSDEDEILEENPVIVEEYPIDVSRQEAKRMILKLFEEKGELGYSEIVSNLNLDLELVVEICDELEQEKKIEGIDS
jgi:hypothetical protein